MEVMGHTYASWAGNEMNMKSISGHFYVYMWELMCFIGYN